MQWITALSRRNRSIVSTMLLAITLGTSCEYAQYNIGNGAGRRGDLDIRERVTNGWRPILITLQEVCERRYNEMLFTLAQYGYRGYFDPTETNACGGASGSGPGFGNAIFFLGDAQGTPVRRTFTRQGSHLRKAMAVDILIGNFRYVAWVTHLENGNCSVAKDQALQLLGWADGLNDLPWVVGGDFNLTPTQSCDGVRPMDYWRFGYSDAGEGRGATHENGSKIDYVFSSFGWTSGYLNTTVRSDHHLLVGVHD